MRYLGFPQVFSDEGVSLTKAASSLFAAMKDDGLIGFARIERSNGGLFDGDRALPNEEGIRGCARGVVGSFNPLIGAVRRSHLGYWPTVDLTSLPIHQ